MINLPERAFPAILRLTKSNSSFLTAEGAENAMRNQALRPASFGPPSKIRSDVDIDVARYGERPVYTVSPKNTTPTRSILYIHGGGFVHSIHPMHWAFIAQLAVEVGAEVAVPIYSLLPYGDSTQAQNLVIPTFRDLQNRFRSVQMVGDSAGTQIILTAALTLRDEGVEGIKTVLISPLPDLTLSNPQIPDVLPSDPWLGRDGTQVLTEKWAGEYSTDDPLVSPIRRDLNGLGSMLIFSGTRDVLNPDANALVHKARADNVDVTFVERPGAVHVFPLLPTRSGNASRRRIVNMLST